MDGLAGAAGGVEALAWLLMVARLGALLLPSGLNALLLVGVGDVTSVPLGAGLNAGAAPAG